MKIPAIILNLFVAVTSMRSLAQEIVDSSSAYNNQGGGNPFKAPQKDFEMFYWGVGIGLFILLIALIYRWRTRGQQ